MRRRLLVEDFRTGRDDISNSADTKMRKLMIQARESRNREAIQKNAKKHKDLSTFIRSRTLEVKCKCNS